MPKIRVASSLHTHLFYHQTLAEMQQLLFFRVDADALWVEGRGQAWEAGRFEKDCNQA